MGSGLHQILKSLCFNTEWSYAIFWKLKHRARMVLTWEDAYCDSCREGIPSDKCSTETLDSLHDGNYSRYLLGLAVAKMSSHVYCLGEGIVGQVAVTGKHQWIIADGHGSNSCPSVEYGDGWLSQFSAGIRTIVVVAVVPHGVLQLGSLNEVSENMKLVTRIRDLFFALQGSSMVSNMIECDMKNLLCLPNVPKRSLTSEITPDSLCSLDKAANVEGANVWFPPFPYFAGQNDTSIVPPLPSICHTKAVEAVKKHGGPGISMPGGDASVTLLNPRSNIIKLEHQNRVGKLLNANNYEGETSGTKGMGLDSEYMFSHSNNCVMDNINVCNLIPPVDNFRDDPPLGLLDSTGCGEVKLDGADLHKNEVLHTNDSSNMKLEEGSGTREFQTEFGQLDTTDPFLKFSAGCELFEALGPAFQKKSFNFNWEGEKVATGTNVEIPEEMSSSKLTYDSGSEHLLEAVVASFCHNGSDVKSEKSFSKSVQSLLTTENMPEPSSQTKHTVNSSGYSIDRPSLIEDGPRHCLNSSELSGVMSSKCFSSPCPSTCSEQFERSSGPAKNKKRARTGENSRPRPRDRQLIQDRIKELRELVPSGSKCSIDSLLERTIKHMLFLQSITKHADKLNKCSDTKSRCKEIGVQGSSTYEQGSSWAVEVGSHLKVCSIIVENLNKNGQMLVEMLCEECSHFLEIAEAIRSLGLTILKGVTEARGDKTWICFVVEGQNNRSIHRMDILWSLVQILQPNTAV